jgi:galactose mutarotase-like enzyme
MENDNGMSATVCDTAGSSPFAGAEPPWTAGGVVLGHAALEGYLENPASFGALNGRNANRLSGAKLPIFGKVHELPIPAAEPTATAGHAGFPAGSGTRISSPRRKAPRWSFASRCRIWTTASPEH